MPTPTPSAIAAGFITIQTLGAVAGMSGTVKEHAYVSDHTKTEIETAGYFNPLADLITDGDLIVVSGDRDGTKFHSSYVVNKPSSGDITLTEHAAVTQNALQVITARVAALGTESDHYVVSPVAGEITAVYGVSNGANGTAQSSLVVKADASEVATLSFSDSYAAGTSVTDGSVQENTISAGEVIHLDNDGAGDGTGEVFVTIVITPA